MGISELLLHLLRGHAIAEHIQLGRERKLGKVHFVILMAFYMLEQA